MKFSLINVDEIKRRIKKLKKIIEPRRINLNDLKPDNI